VLTRDEPRSDAECRWDPASVSSKPFEGSDAVVHLSGSNIAARWTAATRRAIRESRIDATRTLVTALSRLERAPRVLVSASAIGIYGDRGDELLTEASAPGTGFLAELAREWEAEAERASSFGVRVVSLRLGVVVGAGGGMLASLVPLYRWGLGGAPGNGRQWLSWVAIEDAVRAAVMALDQDALHGPLNVVAPEPVTAGAFAQALGRELGRPVFALAPAPLLRLAFGAMADEVLLASQRVRPAGLLARGFVFRRPSLESALSAACKS
jgi:uncharacterized protein (TIGR01777 family)